MKVSEWNSYLVYPKSIDKSQSYGTGKKLNIIYKY